MPAAPGGQHAGLVALPSACPHGGSLPLLLLIPMARPLVHSTHNCPHIFAMCCIPAQAMQLLLHLVKLHPAVDASGALLQPLPRVMRILGGPRCLPTLAQVLSSFLYILVLGCPEAPSSTNAFVVGKPSHSHVKMPSPHNVWHMPLVARGLQ